jgi:formiminoglutamase
MIENWLKPLHLEKVWSDHTKAWQLGAKTVFYASGFELPVWSHFPVALISSDCAGMDAFRKSLYSFKSFQDNFSFLDLGQCRKSNDDFILPLFEEIFNAGVFPILVTNDSAINKAYIKALKNVYSTFHLTAIDDRFRYSPFQQDSEVPYWDSFLSEEIELSEGAHIVGVQTHLLPAGAFSYCEENGISLHRLGQARLNIQDLEPSIRHADICVLEMSSLKYTDFPSQSPQSPSGFFLEEICQLARYAGLSDSLKGFSVSGFNLNNTNQDTDAQALAQIIWYFLDGFNHKKGDFPVQFEGMIEYLVDVKENNRLLTFWKSNRSGRWWIQIERVNKDIQAGEIKVRLIPVSYQDYLDACEGELSSRVLKALVKYS